MLHRQTQMARLSSDSIWFVFEPAPGSVKYLEKSTSVPCYSTWVFEPVGRVFLNKKSHGDVAVVRRWYRRSIVRVFRLTVAPWTIPRHSIPCCFSDSCVIKLHPLLWRTLAGVWTVETVDAHAFELVLVQDLDGVIQVPQRSAAVRALARWPTADAGYPTL